MRFTEGLLAPAEGFLTFLDAPPAILLLIPAGISTSPEAMSSIMPYFSSSPATSPPRLEFLLNPTIGSPSSSMLTRKKSSPSSKVCLKHSPAMVSTSHTFHSWSSRTKSSSL